MTGNGRGRLTSLGVWFAVIIAVAGGTLIAARSLIDGFGEEVTSTLAGRADPAEVYDPVAAGEPLPTGFRQIVWRDQIEPVYDPVFTRAASVDWPPTSLVVGVAGAESAKAYPVTQLNSREMVIDSLEGIPILVTW